MDRYGAGAVDTITFDYGQRHRIELECAAGVAGFADVPNRVFPIDTFEALGGNALTDAGIHVEEDGNGGLPNTFVPGRNIVFLTFAAAYAWQRKIGHIVTGVAQTDYSGYPDCRQETIDALESTVRLGMESKVEIHTPLMNLSKKETVQLARDLGALEALALTHTCYNGKRAANARPAGCAPRDLMRRASKTRFSPCRHDLLGQGNLLHAAGRGRSDRPAGRVPAFRRLQSLDRP